MKRDAILTLAKQAGMAGLATTVVCEIDELESFAKLIAAEERESCAVAAWMAGMDEHNKARGMPCDAREVGSAGAQAIRMRSNAGVTGNGEKI